MRLTIAGSGTAAPEADRVCPGFFVEADGTRALFDCGPGVVHHMARYDLPWPELDHVFLSHFHNDHTGDLPMLLFALKWGVPGGRRRPLTLWGPEGVVERVEAMAAAYGEHVLDPGFPVSIRVLSPGDVEGAGSTTVAVASTPHTEESLAFRITARANAAPGEPEGPADRPAASVGYTGDTGPSPEVASFLAGVDVLVAECSLPEEEAKSTHLTPSSLAAMAGAARPGRLVVVHVYPQLAVHDVVERVREAGYDGAITRGHDGFSVTLER